MQPQQGGGGNIVVKITSDDISIKGAVTFFTLLVSLKNTSTASYLLIIYSQSVFVFVCVTPPTASSANSIPTPRDAR